MEFLQGIIDAILSFSTSGVFAAVLMVVEMLMRLIKTEKPMSIIYIVSGALKKVSEILTLVASLLDKVLPQKLK